MNYVLPPALPASVPVAGRDERFAVRRIYCVGRNYAEHAREMGHDPEREPPFFFSKPADSLLTDDRDLPYPSQTGDLHFEGELVVALGKGARDIAADDALQLVWGYAAGNDFTRRDLQAVAKKLGRPWDLAKGFDHSAACGRLHSVAQVGHLASGRIRALVNGEVRQDGDLSQMIWSVAEIIATLSQSVALEAGDLIFTGTPAGVGAVERGDIVAVEIAGLSPLVTAIR
ncbi:fumarylacetoacetate hydrolase family protein [Aquamicrobium sp. LC103]|uniref:fumarylacetoacetate hydrolase family protein n=1 Tax=Aquamicrobium sp. LC103 TaxID=1120658 RepID=UPI00063E93B1|nr:fumarylacetoacetate hydrolase family protein [Aquamicrobium sp. LC103]TKT69599.1 fumarylacetoacetate hydrolase family protein [Aquamicrobium sp. LC103]